jgi:LCP family protein required for cell wall assembly
MAKINRSPFDPDYENEVDAEADDTDFAQDVTGSDSDAFFAEPGARPSIYDIAEGRATLSKDEQTQIFSQKTAQGSAPKREDHTMIYRPDQDPPDEFDDPEPEQSALHHTPKRGWMLLVLQAALSILSLLQLYRTQMLPALYLGILGVLLLLAWWLVYRGQRHRVRGVLSRLFSLVLCAAMAIGCIFAQQGLRALSGITSGLLAGSEARAIVTEPFVVYLSGIDTRGELTEKARSDVNIIAVVNPTTKQVALINTPRDYYVSLAGTDSKDKLTHAGLYGVESSMQTLGNLYGIDVEYYVRINFAGFMGIIDAVGGIDVYSDYTFTSVGSPGYYDPTDFVEGWNHMDGQAALAFARERHAFASGDVQRGINQMKVIQAMVDKLKSPTLLLTYSRLMSAVSDCFVTNLSSDQIAALVRMQLSDAASWNIQSMTVTGTNSTSTKCYSAKGQKLYVMLPDDTSVAQAQNLIEQVCAGEILNTAEDAAA